MNSKKSEQRVVRSIRYFLPLFVLVTTFLIALFVTYEHKRNISSEKFYIEEQYIKEQKEQIKSDLERVYKYIETKNNEVVNDLKIELKNKIKNTYSILNSIYENNKDKKSKEEILEQMKYAIKDIRFSNDKGYFFIYSLKGDVILNPLFPNLEGKNLFNYKDSRGTYIVQDMAKILKTEDETYYDWYWKDPLIKEEKEFLKIGYFKKFEPFDIFIGTGFYLNDYINKLKDEIVAHTSTLRYKDDRYIFIIDDKYNLIVNKHKSILNENIITNKSLNHMIKYIRELKSQKNNEGLFFNYDLIIKEEKETIKKISYSLRFKEWDWIIGTGFTMESANLAVKKRQDVLTKKYKAYLNNIYVLGFIFTLLILIISYFISKYIEKSFYIYTNTLEDKQRLLIKSQNIALLGDWQLNLETMEAYWSDSILKIFGLKSRPSFTGPEFLKTIMHKDDWKCFEDSIKSTIKYHNEHMCTYRIFRPDGKIVWIECRGEYEENTGKIIGIIQDITARKEFEIDKERKEKLLYQQSKMAAMGEMIGNIAHQWRQPLSVISTASTGVKLKKEMNILSDEDLIETMDSINDSSQYLSQTIEDFRNFFSPNDKNLKLVKVEKLFEKTLNLVSAQFTSKGIEIVKDISSYEIKTLKNELIQVLINILNNSKDVLLELNNLEHKYIFIKTYKEDNSFKIEIYDNGKGISNEIISRVFEPYFTTKYKSQGTGIGLYMSQEIVVKLLDGEIYAENIEYEYAGKNYSGAKFTIKLPLEV